MIKVLDHGYVSIVEPWGSDERIVEAARMSTDKGFLGWGEWHADMVGESPVSAPMDLERGNISPETVKVWEGAGKPDSFKLGFIKYSNFEFKAGDEKLLRYLYEHRHHTPFEMAGLIIEVKAPIFVFREWHRHRTQCLAGDTQITLVTPNGTTFKRSIRDIYTLKHGGSIDLAPKKHRNGKSKSGSQAFRDARIKVPWRTRVLPNCQSRVLRVLDEESRTFTTAVMADVWESGIKPIYTLYAGQFQVSASEDHPFYTKRGWIKMKDIAVGDEVARMGKIAAHARPIPPALRSGIGVWTTMMRSRIIGTNSTPCYLCGIVFKASELQLDHVIPVTQNLLLALDESNLKPACYPCHRTKTDQEQPSREGFTHRGIRWEVVKRLPKQTGVEMTYDIEVLGPHHNYCANDLVVHNSYNEMSARYIPMPDENYLPSLDRLMINAGGSNKQAGTIKDSEILTEPMAEIFRGELEEIYGRIERLYKYGLNIGVPKELARLPIPVARYSKMRASANLRNWLGFLTLRMDPAAQWEIRQYANAVGEIIAEKFPRTWDLFVAGKK